MQSVIVGLGNPGKEYEFTRHNVGRMAVEAFAKSLGIEEWRDDTKANARVARIDATTLVLPDTFMNKSGNAVLRYVKSPKMAQNMIVVYDDLDLPLGRMKVSFARSDGGHNGLKSVMRAVKTDEFIRLRIGVSPTTPSGKTKKPEGEEKVLKFILGAFTPKEKILVKKMLARASDALERILRDGYVHAMNVVNTQ